MSNVVVAMFLTLDGVMEDPSGSEGFQHGGWQLPFFDPDMATGVRDGLFAAGALLLGRVTYEQFAAAWASMPDEEGFAERMNTMPKYVASTTLREPLAWNATLLDGDMPAAVAKLKQQPGGDLLVQGSGTLVRTLMQRNLIDAYQLWVHPVVLGSGKRLFANGVAPTSLQLVDTKTTSAGVVALTYQTAGTATEE
jgi:dihydrofolate reductase